MMDLLPGVIKRGDSLVRCMRAVFVAGLLLLSYMSQGQIKLAKLKYGGGGDWYANKTALPNLIRFCSQQLSINLAPEEDAVEVGSRDLFSYPYVYMTGHGNVVFTPEEAQNLRNYLIAGDSFMSTTIMAWISSYGWN